jgi:hypothetical protein
MFGLDALALRAVGILALAAALLGGLEWVKEHFKNEGRA